MRYDPSRPIIHQPVSGAPGTVILEVRAAAGGDDAARFASSLMRAYLRYALRCDWKVSILAEDRDTDRLREGTYRFAGNGVAGLRSEAGTHRVVQEASRKRDGRRHTSAVTVAVLPVEPAARAALALRDVDISTFRASGAGGQHMQKTETAVRVVHRPTGLTAVVQDERSQASNKERALEVLSARLDARLRQAADGRVAATRAAQVGSGAWAERIRSYTEDADRVVDHRTGVAASLRRFMAGDLGAFVGA